MPRHYVIHALNGTPDVLQFMLDHLPVHAPEWDHRPYPDRFTMREVMAHLADFEAVCLARLQRTKAEENPFLENWDEEKAVTANHYAESDPLANLESFRQQRSQLVQFLGTLAEADWQRPAERERVGPMPLYAQVVLILAHDGYHTQQVAQWLNLSKQAPQQISQQVLENSRR
jgi:uncharacterized damage-inducible protein DinB